MVFGGIRNTQAAENIVQKEWSGKIMWKNLIPRCKVVPLER